MIYETEDMPFSQDTGIIPDILFNPHGYPTRMTMGMIFETIAGKAAAINGSFVDATPFKHLLRSVLNYNILYILYRTVIIAKAALCIVRIF